MQSAGGGLTGSGGNSAGTGGESPTGGSSAFGGKAGNSAGQASTGGIAAGSGVGGHVAAGSPPSTGGVAANDTTGGNAAGDGAASGSKAGGSSTGGSSASGGGDSGGPSGASGAQSGGGAAGTGATVPAVSCPDTTWRLVWGDDFEGASGTAVDDSNWTYDTGPNWYNGELQAYTPGTDNASLDGSGNLVIEARREAREGRQYTSARLKTEGKKTFTYGRFEGRMKLPYGQGLWPAFWMLGGNSWPNTGEIDIMENLGREPSILHGTIHGPGYSGAAGPSGSYTLPDGAKFSDDFHVFAIEWEAAAIRWYVDGKLYSTKTPSDIAGSTWVFDHPFFFIVNVAVGGEWPGNPDDTTVFPQRMLIDYIRVCEK
jgi:beta-glucanase (GH16 family)